METEMESVIEKETPKQPCLWCGDDFTPLDPTAKYCNHKHRKNAKMRRQKFREILASLEQDLEDGKLTPGKCPTPLKRTFTTEEHARMFHAGQDQYTYRCICGGMHLATHRGYNRRNQMIRKNRE